MVSIFCRNFIIIYEHSEDLFVELIISYLSTAKQFGRIFNFRLKMKLQIIIILSCWLACFEAASIQVRKYLYFIEIKETILLL